MALAIDGQPDFNSLADRDPNFFPHAVCFLLLTFGTAGLIGHAIGRFYTPQPLTPALDRVAESDRFILLFGNSRFEAGIDPVLLAKELSATSGCETKMFTGGGWDSLHYYMLSLLNADLLRANRDAVIIEVSPLSLNDADYDNRLGVIRPETALAVACLRGEPTETRLSILLGRFVGLYRYRTSIQQGPLNRSLLVAANSLSGPLSRFRLIGLPQSQPAFRLVPAPGREFVIQEIEGDELAFKAANRDKLQASWPTVRFGSFKLRALEQAVWTLRNKNIEVYLVGIPVSDWFRKRFGHSPISLAFRDSLTQLARESGAKLILDWPEDLYNDAYYWDDTHMTSRGTKQFTECLAKRIKSYH